MIRTFWPFQPCKCIEWRTSHSNNRANWLKISIRFRLPFNWKTPFGYLIACIAQSLAAVSIAFCFIPLFILLIASCCLLKSFASEIIAQLRFMDGDNDINRKEIKMREHFCHAIQLFADTKQLSKLIGPSKISWFFFQSPSTKSAPWIFVDWRMSSTEFSNLLRRLFFYGLYLPWQAHCWRFKWN